jgi:sugar lactone lactonase YvrE
MLPTLLLLGSSVFSLGEPNRLGAYRWNVQYLVDQSQTVGGESQRVFPRHNRGMAISPDEKFLYAGYHHTEDGFGEVRRIRIGDPGTCGNDFTSATVKVLRGFQGKAIAVDPDGRVYIASGEVIAITDAGLSHPHYEIETARCNGVAVTKEGGKTVLYASERGISSLHRWEMKIKEGRVVDAVPAGFGGDGTVDLPGGISLRGLCIDSKGRILCADIEGNRLFRIDNDGKEIISTFVESPMAVACDGDLIFVSQWRQRRIALFDDKLAPAGTIEVPWEELQLNPTGNNKNGALSAIAILPKRGFFVCNERGQTANQKSTYGKADKSSGTLDGKLYMDVKTDDNEPILFAHPVDLAPTAAAK